MYVIFINIIVILIISYCVPRTCILYGDGDYTKGSPEIKHLHHLIHTTHKKTQIYYYS